jgi:signal transduction histidine kinase
MGLAGLEERVLALHGRFAVENLSGQGVRIVALLPRTRVLEIA